MKEIDTLLAKYASHLMEKEKVLSAIELYPHAHNSALRLFASNKCPCAPIQVVKIYMQGNSHMHLFKELKYIYTCTI